MGSTTNAVLQFNDKRCIHSKKKSKTKIIVGNKPPWVVKVHPKEKGV